MRVLNDKNSDLPEPWQWPGLWSLNLPVILVLWQMHFGQSFYVWLTPYHLFTTAALAWGFIATERWIFFFRLAPNVAREMVPESKFADQRDSMFRICVLILVGLILMGIFRANTRELAGMSILTSLGGAYLLALRLAPSRTDSFLPLEAALTGYLAGATALFIWANATFPTGDLLLPSVMFGLLLLYFLCMASDEAKELLPTGSPLSPETSRYPPYLGAAMPLILAAAVMSVFIPEVGGRTITMTIGITGIILLLLNFWRSSLSKSTSRMLANIAMMTPVLPLILLR